MDEKSCSTLSLRCHCVLATSMEFSLYDLITLVRRGRSHYALALNNVCQCLPRQCTFVVGSHCVFVTSRDLSLNTRIIFSTTRICFNNDTAAQWLSGRMLDSKTEGPGVRASQALLLCILEQDTLILA